MMMIATMTRPMMAATKLPCDLSTPLAGMTRTARTTPPIMVTAGTEILVIVSKTFTSGRILESSIDLLLHLSNSSLLYTSNFR